MALHPDFPDSPHIILDPAIRSLAPGRRKLAVKVVASLATARRKSLR